MHSSSSIVTFCFISFIFFIVLSSSTEATIVKTKTTVLNAPGGVSVPIRHIPNPSNVSTLIRRAASPTAPPYKYSGGSWAIGLVFGDSSETLYLNLDTGSYDLFVAGPSCSNCIEAPSIYSPSSSAVTQSCSSQFCNGQDVIYGTNYCYKSVCTSNATYADGSGVTANIVYDKVGIPGLSNRARAYFGSITTEYTGEGSITYLSEGQAGLVGTAYASESSMPTGSNNVLDSIMAANNLNNVFSLCINKTYPWMSVGADYYNVSGFTYTPTVMDYGRFEIQVTDMSLIYPSSSSAQSFGLSRQEYNAEGVIVDSGTTEIYFDPGMYNAFHDLLVQNCNTYNLNGICGQGQDIFSSSEALTSSEIAAYPTISITIPCDTATCTTLKIPPTSYLSPVGRNQYIGVIFSNSAGGTILGDAFMQNYHVVFDKVRNKIGFASPNTCSLSGANNGTIVAPNAGCRLSPAWMDFLPSI